MTMSVAARAVGLLVMTCGTLLLLLLLPLLLTFS